MRFRRYPQHLSLNAAVVALAVGMQVEWYPWGDEAFEAARQQDKPIFLSVGYATCHW
jgi:uncharacterized protein YyaL (SSP411 family)